MIIYKTTNIINGKIYVGKDCSKHPGYMGSGIALHRAIKKYGANNFIKEILEECDLSNVCEREIYWIDKLNSTDINIGYNLTIGGDGASPGRLNVMYGKHHSEETKRKISNRAYPKGKDHYNFGKPMPEEQKKLISKNHYDISGKNHPNYGKHLSKETIEKIRKSNTGKKMSEEAKIKMMKNTVYLRGKDSPNFGKHPSEETRKKMRDSHPDLSGKNNPMFGKFGEKNPMYGKRHSEETRRKIREALALRRM